MEMQAAELKLELKRWELEFYKNNLRKPTKTDVTDFPEIKKKYEQFVLLKKRLQHENLGRSKNNDGGCENNENQPKLNHPEGNCQKYSDELQPPREKKILSPKNSAPITSGKKNVWGTDLLKKNTTKKDLPNDEQKSSTADVSPVNEKSPTWRDNIRKNIGLDMTRRLPTSLKRHSNKSGSNCKLNTSMSTSFGPDTDIENSKPDEDMPNPNAFFGPVKILSKSKMGSSLSSPAAAGSPFSAGRLMSRKSSLLSKPIKMDVIGDEDLSDLTFTTENETEQIHHHSEYEENISNLPERPQLEKHLGEPSAKTSDVQTKEDETESFIETNFKQKFSFSQGPPKLNYDSVCLPPTESKPQKVTEDASVKKDSDSKGIPKKVQVKSAGGAKVSQTNFVRLNMKKKCFSKRGGAGNFLRKQVFRQKLSKKGFSFKSGWKGRSGGAGGWKGSGGGGFRDKSEDKCFKCGGSGHWASKCKGQGFQTKKTVDPEEEAQNKESLQEILENIDMITAAMKGESTEPLLQKLSVSVAEPVLSLGDGNITDNEAVMDALKMFKYDSFRPGQDIAISRILRGLPTLLVLSTGSGKSLCYQLPAYLYATKRNAITLVVSPLVSLMDDQVRGLPRMMKATRIHSGMTKEQRAKALAEVESGKVHVLLVSPEAITSWAGMSARFSPLCKLPPIAFACIDECHCLSEWSHAFRPSYLRVCQVLREQLGIKCLIGLTATATMDTCASVARQLGINDLTEGVVAKIDIPDNLVLSVSQDRYKDEALSQLLLGDRFSKLNSVIVYCTRRDEASRIAGLLRMKMQDMPSLQQAESESEDDVGEEETGSNKRKRPKQKVKKAAKRKVVTLDAECYHAGMSAAERRRIQNRFMNGTLRVVVATVAFGMGIDKQDVRSVIHYNMPMSFERYVQEVGRAGRDGNPAHCHLFLDPEAGDLYELSRHAYGKTLDRYTVKKFVKKVFPKCRCESTDDDDEFPSTCPGHFASINIDKAVEDLDVKREGLETLLCYLEIEGLIQVNLPTDTECSLQFYGGPGQMLKAARKCPAVAVALKVAGTKENETQITFNATKVADELSVDLPSLKKLLRYLTWDTTLAPSASEVGKSGIEVEFSGLSFCLQTKKKATNDFLDAVTDLLHRRVVAQENKEITQLKLCFDTMQQFSQSNVGNCKDSTDVGRSTELKSIITKYFRETQEVKDTEEEIIALPPNEETELRSAVRQFLHIHANDLEHQVTGRAIARIFHGIDSPRYPARSWGPARRFWRSKLHLDFNAVRKVATEEIVGNM